MAEGWGGDLWKERNGLLGEKKNPPKACEADFHGDRSVLPGEKDNPPKAREADFGREKSGLYSGKEKAQKACEADCLEKRNGVTWERVHSGAENAARCMCWRSTLHRLAQRAASAIAPHCVSRLTLLLLVPRRHRLLRQAPLSSPARAPDTIGRGCKEEAPSCSFPVRKVQVGALLYPVTLHSSDSTSQRKGAGWSGHSV